MDFFSIILFLILYYIRPHEWISGVAMLRPFQLTVGLAIVALFYKHRGLGWRDFIKTPHDWMMLIFFLWTVLTASEIRTTFSDVNNVFVFYWVTVIALDNRARIQKFLKWWAILIMIVAALAVASQYGFDPMGSYDLTQGEQKSRLALNTSIFDNPNALGHSIVPGVAMVYFLWFWRRPIFLKILTPLILFVPLYCIYLTVSKGAFISGFATIINSLTFKRPKGVQIAIFVIAGTMGWAAMQALPRMGELQTSRTDEAIRGRVAAFRFGLEMMNSKTTGVGFGRFQREFFRANHYPKAAHSTYVDLGCELGEPGLYIFLSLIYCCLRTLVFALTENEEEERIRRILFALVVSFSVSSWMCTWGYRAVFYLMVAATAAFHRLLLAKNQPVTAPSGEIEIQPLTQLPFNTFQPVTTPGGIIFTRHDILFSQPDIKTPLPEKLFGSDAKLSRSAGILWNRITWVDLVLTYLMLQVTILYWKHLINTM